MKLVDGFYYPENAVQAAVFVGKKMEFDITFSNLAMWNYARFPLSTVAEVCKANGGATFVWTDIQTADESPTYYCVYGDDWYEATRGLYSMIAANAVTIGLTVGELRTLIGWYNE